MFRRLCGVALIVLGCAASVGSADDKSGEKKSVLPKPESDGFMTIFNGKNLTGWDGLKDYWEVKDGVISGHETKDKSKQTFLVFTGCNVSDFELRIKYKFATEDGNSGIQFRSKVLDPKSFRVGGYQADCDAKGGYDGVFYDEASVAGGRGIMSNRGETTTWDVDNVRHNQKLSGNDDLKKVIKVGDLNDVVLIAKGRHMSYRINGHLMTDMIDDSPKALKEGVLALQLHAGYTMDVQFKDIKLKLLEEKKAQGAGASQSGKIKALIVDGQNNHTWQKTTPVLKAALESSGLFTVDVATSPPQGKKMDDFRLDFSKYGVVVSNYNGDEWPETTRKAFEEYVKLGGGFVCVHAADNSFPKWLEYNKMIGVGGWGGRNDKFGPMLRWRDGKVEKDAKGGHGTHGSYHSFVVETRDTEHPITKGLPAKWLHTPDELYATLCGPAENVTVLATAKSDVTQEHEPMLMVIRYGKGRVFHTTLGHDVGSMLDVGFVTTLDRGAEWAATGKVTQKVPENFPTADKASRWEPEK